MNIWHPAGQRTGCGCSNFGHVCLMSKKQKIAILKQQLENLKESQKNIEEAIAELEQ